MRNRKRFVWLFAGVLILVLGWKLFGSDKRAEGEQENMAFKIEEFDQITANEAKRIMDSETGYQIVDVRTEEEFELGHIPGAICIPNETIGLGVREILTDPEQKILVYCRSGVRSVMASEKLCMLGYKNVVEFGGIIDWTFEIER